MVARKNVPAVSRERDSDAEKEVRKLESQALGAMLTDPKLHCGAVVAAYGSPLLKHWREFTAGNAADGLEAIVARVKAGDLGDLEEMLVAQAVALQLMFTTMANQASGASARDSRNLYATLALKAQAQSRATITALADIKLPRGGAIFAKQANVAHGPQQVNNNGVPAHAPAHAREQTPAAPNGVFALEASNGSTTMDAGAARPAGAAHSQLEPVEVVHRPANRKGQGRGRAQR